MQVKILGSFEVLRDGVLITPRAAKPRRVLALLAVCGNSVVRADQIIEELWEDRPPLSATTTLQTYIYQLRKHLHSGRPPAATSQSPLRTCPGGYMLSLPPDALDSSRFERLAERGRAEIDAGDVETAARTFRQALEVWRGPVLSDIGIGPILHGEAVRLSEARKTVLEQRIDAELELGCHQELIGELSGAVAEQPTHEGFWAKLMLALYRAGRRSDALASFQQARNALASELGLEPSHELQRLHLAVLSADPSLTPAPVSGTAQVRRSVPVERPDQLPAPGAHLVGRESQQEALCRALTTAPRDTPAVAAVFGSPGSGKTALAVRVARRLGDAYPDGALYASLMGEDAPVEAREVLRRFLVTLGTPPDRVPESTEERVWAFRACTSDRRVIVVLDDVIRREQVLPLLPSGSGCAALVVARRRFAHPAVGSSVGLPPLEMQHGLEMLSRTLGRGPSGPDDPARRELVELCSGLPLVLHSAATRMQVRPHWGARFLVSRLRCDPPQIVEGPDDEPTFAGSVDRSRRALSPAARRAFAQLAVEHQPAFSLAAASAALSTDPGNAEALLEELVEFQLAVVESTAHQNGQFRYTLPRLVRLAADRRPGRAPTRMEAIVPAPRPVTATV
jgi:DNA-binding SARP family transcriptional activator